MKFFDKIYYRAAGTPFTTIAQSGLAGAGFILLVGAIADKTKNGMEPDAKSEMGDGSQYTESVKCSPEIVVKNFTAANYATILAAFVNTHVDVLFMDSAQPALCSVAWNTVLYPAIDVSGEAQIKLAGEKKTGVGATALPFGFTAIT